MPRPRTPSAPPLAAVRHGTRALEIAHGGHEGVPPLECLLVHADVAERQCPAALEATGGRLAFNPSERVPTSTELPCRGGRRIPQLSRVGFLTTVSQGSAGRHSTTTLPPLGAAGLHQPIVSPTFRVTMRSVLTAAWPVTYESGASA